MKKIITLCLFAFAMILGTNSIDAQNTIEINAEASKKTEELRRLLKFDNNQRDEVYLAYKEFGKAKANLENTNVPQVEGALDKLENSLVKKMEGILNNQQFERYKEYIKETR